ncbi:RagB/SusD family nutrient uptake outer membrane protein [Siphonobacter curvatus]|uniref:RagB/SusD family nutrient uptake outer membrane protein n=1 Tax=Siphonobacter curvatus TaxID=2094562 RepID=A0A2S7IMW6_9BACT|nr:RagB/SusD family nutrient uptake outer membrane protein [Siphonobacter curvatus]PQA59067.1 RagB/SusD family nutrient uptake outer membrane protein [Siphonobacter curvatus]
MKRYSFHQSAYGLMLVLATLTGCTNSFLDLAPISNANSENFYRTTADFDLAANAAMATLYTVYGPEGPVSYAGEIQSDNVTLNAVAGIQADKWAYRDYTLNSTNTINYSFWQIYYSALYNVNIVIQKLESASLNEDYKKSVRAQMLFLRSLYYFNMVRTWGDVPLVLTPITAAESYTYARKPQAEVYQQILSDLQYAAENLPLASATTKGKPTQGAAQTLLGKVYLTLNDKTNAARVLKAVYDSKQYSLVPAYASLWSNTNKNTSESIFEIQFLGGSPTSPYSEYYQTFFPAVSYTGYIGGGINQVTNDLWNEYEPGDPRKTASIDTGYVDTKGVFQSIKFPKKWNDKTTPVTTGKVLGLSNFMVLRYADLLLMLSEATDDPTYLNQVRTRAGVPTYGSANYPSGRYGTLALALEHERRVELALEFHRWFDLKRTNRAIPVLTTKGKPTTESKLIAPIPLTVLQQNSIITQNPGYN